MAVQGQNFFAAFGDNSTWSSSNETWPGDDANIVSVGGTDLITASGGTLAVRNRMVSGGVSPDNIVIPSWQRLPGVINSTNQGSITYRNGQDVSANANFTFYVCADRTACTANEYGARRKLQISGVLDIPTQTPDARGVGAIEVRLHRRFAALCPAAPDLFGIDAGGRLLEIRCSGHPCAVRYGYPHPYGP